MTKGAKYLLDSSVMTQAARMYYAFDIAPGFWSGLAEKIDDGVIVSIDRVLDELKRGKDELANWATGDVPDAFLDSSGTDVLNVYKQLMTWAFGEPQFQQVARDEFALADNADAWLVAYAKVHKLILVTQEESAPKAQKVIKIPDVCIAFKVQYCGTFEMLRALGIKLNVN